LNTLPIAICTSRVNRCLTRRRSRLAQHPIRRAVLQLLKQYRSSPWESTVVGAIFVVLAPMALAGPQGGVVAAGQARISNTRNLTTVTQQSARSVIDWQSFNVSATEAVNFIQPAASSATLNRVGGGDPSSILGRITANGRIFLVNPNGVLFGAGAQVNVGGLVASTANISNGNFMAGVDRFEHAGRGRSAGGLPIPSSTTRHRDDRRVRTSAAFGFEQHSGRNRRVGSVRWLGQSRQAAGRHVLGRLRRLLSGSRRSSVGGGLESELFAGGLKAVMM